MKNGVYPQFNFNQTFFFRVNRSFALLVAIEIVGEIWYHPHCSISTKNQIWREQIKWRWWLLICCCRTDFIRHLETVIKMGKYSHECLRMYSRPIVFHNKALYAKPLIMATRMTKITEQCVTELHGAPLKGGMSSVE